ncbi:MAG: DUF134 domain-containing protein [Thermodesulfobacteriota bacterium]
MARPKCCRRISQQPACAVFKPVGVPFSTLDEIVLSMDEFEALRLADLEGLHHEEAAERMSVSRQTFGRIVEAARRKVAQVLVGGLALRVEGGVVKMAEQRTFLCDQCQHTWSVPFGTGRPGECPACKGSSIHRSEHGGGRSGERGSCRRQGVVGGKPRTMRG